MNHPRPLIVFLAQLAMCGWCGVSATADSVVLFPVKDNTIANHGSDQYSNGMGDSVYAGRTGTPAGEIPLRALIQFDLAAIPPGSTIVSARVTLYQIMTVSGGHFMSLHRVSADWGEGASSFPGGFGAPSEPGDASWDYRFYPSTTWANPGGDYDPTASASTVCETSGVDYVWDSPQLGADVQAWLDDPCVNFGWILIGNEAASFTAKRFASREYIPNPDASPRLRIEYLPAPNCAGDVNHNQVVDIDDLVAVITTWGACEQLCRCQADLDHNSTVDIDDLVTVITNWGGCRNK